MIRAGVAVMIAIAALSETAARPIDVEHSRLTVFVYRAGLLSAFGDDHVISAPIRGGTISMIPSPSIDLVVNTADLTVLDPGLGQEERDEVRARMLGPDVLDTPKFPTIRFESTAIERTAEDRWNVSGRLSIRGITRPVTLAAVEVSGRYIGEVTIRQRDFGIQPIRVMGGTVRVKDELKIAFEIAA
ncbi:MAG: YceI family protein [Burkholderiales bacterium]